MFIFTSSNISKFWNEYDWNLGAVPDWLNFFGFVVVSYFVWHFNKQRHEESKELTKALNRPRLIVKSNEQNKYFLENCGEGFATNITLCYMKQFQNLKCASWKPEDCWKHDASNNDNARWKLPVVIESLKKDGTQDLFWFPGVWAVGVYYEDNFSNKYISLRIGENRNTFVELNKNLSISKACEERLDETEKLLIEKLKKTIENKEKYTLWALNVIEEKMRDRLNEARTRISQTDQWKADHLICELLDYISYNSYVPCSSNNCGIRQRLLAKFQNEDQLRFLEIFPEDSRSTILNTINDYALFPWHK